MQEREVLQENNNQSVASRKRKAGSPVKPPAKRPAPASARNRTASATTVQKSGAAVASSAPSVRSLDRWLWILTCKGHLRYSSIWLCISLVKCKSSIFDKHVSWSYPIQGKGCLCLSSSIRSFFGTNISRWLAAGRGKLGPCGGTAGLGTRGLPKS